MTGPGAIELINESVSLDDPQSFFLYAGAGSGKTAQLVKALQTAETTWGPALRARDSRVRVITFTNAAAEEIKIRLGRDPLVEVSTIHSFAWSLISPFTKDIAAWLLTRLQDDIADLTAQEVKGRAGTQASERRIRDIEQKTQRLDTLGEVRRFTYSPSQASRGTEGLAHAEVLHIAAHLLTNKPVFQELLIGRYPLLFIDEVQDTSKSLMDAILEVQRTHPSRFCVGLFGDTMQRIYSDGKAQLEEAIGPGWQRPELDVNYRSAQRIVRLVNSIRAGGDGRTQSAQAAHEGSVRLFIAHEDLKDRPAFEGLVRSQMSDAASDAAWSLPEEVKTLILEHSMAAIRHGFADFYAAFSSDTTLRQNVFSRDQAGAGIVNFLGTQFLPLIRSILGGNTAATESILRQHSPLLDQEREARDLETRAQLVGGLRLAVSRLREAITGDDQPILATLTVVHETGLLELPGLLAFIVEHPEPGDSLIDDVDVDRDSSLEAWRLATGVEVAQVQRFYEYIVGGAPFDTHQGVKGLEFDRVLVVLDDKSAGGFLFSYGKLFGTTPPSKTDQDHAAAGRENVNDRTLRLFYVVCSRAKESLAVVLYTSDPPKAKTAAVDRGWFTESEIVLQEDLDEGTD